MICMCRRMDLNWRRPSSTRSTPFRCIVPLVGSTSLSRERARVVFPLPDSPTRASTSPCSKFRSTPSTALIQSRRPSHPLPRGNQVFRPDAVRNEAILSPLLPGNRHNVGCDSSAEVPGLFYCIPAAAAHTWGENYSRWANSADRAQNQESLAVVYRSQHRV